jgi:hypothetical protein
MHGALNEVLHLVISNMTLFSNKNKDLTACHDIRYAYIYGYMCDWLIDLIFYIHILNKYSFDQKGRQVL